MKNFLFQKITAGKHLVLLFGCCIMIQRAKTQVTVLDQFVNPCGNDQNNEFIIFQTSSAINIANLALGSYDPTGSVDQNYNHWWYGSNVPSCPYSANFSAYIGDNCSPASGIAAYTFLYPSVSSDNTIINDLINQLNTAAGCTVFLPVPADNMIPANSSVVIFNGAGSCGFNNVNTNLNFSTHCSAGNPIIQYYVVFGRGNCGLSGYFSNSQPRVTKLWIYKGSGSVTDSGNYYRPQQYYDPGTAPGSGNAGVVIPGTDGAGTWINTEGCVPAPATLGVLSATTIELSAVKMNDFIRLNWKPINTSTISKTELQKSDDGNNFTSIYRETSTAASVYDSHHYDDPVTQAPYAYYRVKLVLENGKIIYSRTVKIKLTGNDADNIKVLPNPVLTDLYTNITIGITDVYDISIVNAAGAKVYAIQKFLSRGIHSLILPTAHLSPGIYFIQLRSGQRSLYNSFLKK